MTKLITIIIAAKVEKLKKKQNCVLIETIKYTDVIKTILSYLTQYLKVLLSCPPHHIGNPS